MWADVRYVLSIWINWKKARMMTMAPVRAPRLMAMVRPIFSRVSKSNFRITNQGHSANMMSIMPPYTTRHVSYTIRPGYPGMPVRCGRQIVPIVVPPRYWRSRSGKDTLCTGRYFASGSPSAGIQIDTIPNTIIIFAVTIMAQRQ